MTLDARSISAILLKVTGLVLIVVCVAQLPGYLPLASRGYDFSFGEALAAAAVALGPLTLLGLGLWFFPGTVTNRVVANAPVDSVAVDVRPIELVALTILGVYLVASGLIGTVRDVALLIVTNRQHGDLGLIPASVIGHFAGAIAEIVIGLGLCIGAKGVSRVIEKLRQ